MSKSKPIAVLHDDERKLLIEGLTALRREHNNAWNVASAAAVSNAKRQPSLR